MTAARPAKISADVAGSGTLPTSAVNTPLAADSSNKRIPPDVTTSLMFHCNKAEGMTPVEKFEVISQVLPPVTLGKLYKSVLPDTREKPTPPVKLFTNILVPVTKLKVPRSAIVMEVLSWIRLNPLGKDVRLLVSPCPMIVNALPVKALPPMDPDAAVAVKLVVIEAACR